MHPLQGATETRKDRMTDHARRKQQLIVRGAVYRAQILNSGKAIRRGANIRTMAAQAWNAAAGSTITMVREKLHLKQGDLKRITPVVLEKVSVLSSVSTRRMRKPVLYGAMVLGAMSALPRIFKERKSNDGN